MKKTFQILGMMLVCFALITSCKKDKQEDPAEDEETQTTSDQMVTENTYNEAHSIADEAATGDLKTFRVSSPDGILSSCATITRDTINHADADTIIVDFGTNCVGHDGKNRSGKIIVTYTGRYRDAGSTIVITFDGYHVNNHTVTGTRTIHNNGKNTDGHTSWNITEHGKMILANGAEISRDAEHVREIIEGEGTDTHSDDVFKITGHASGSNKKGTYTANIIEPLIKKASCKNFTAGILEFTPAGKVTRTIDFSINSDCNGKCKVKIHGKRRNFEKEIEL